MYTEDNIGADYRYDKTRIKKLSTLGCKCVREPSPEVTFHQIGKHMIKNGEENGSVEIGGDDNEFIYRVRPNGFDFKKKQSQIYEDDDEDEAVYSLSTDDTQPKFIDEEDLVRYILSYDNKNVKSSSYEFLETQQQITQTPKTTQTSTITTQAPTQTQASTKNEAPTTQAPKIQAPITQAPTTQVPTTQAPTNQAPTTQAPATQAPATQDPTTQASIKTEAPTQPPPNTQPLTTEPPKITQTPETTSNSTTTAAS